MDLNILIIDDEPAMLMSYDTALRMRGVKEVYACLDPVIGLEKAKVMKPQIILLDLMLGPYRGEDFIEPLSMACPEASIIIVSALEGVDVAVRCVRLGAEDYLIKPLATEKLYAIIDRANSKPHHAQDAEEAKHLKHRSKSMTNVMNQVHHLAPTPYPILITGETGTGKELAAREIHHLSGSTGELISLNIAGLDDNVFSDTLFGHVKGAFTGAERTREGLIQKAKGGTLFLDEIGDLDPKAQLKLLRLLQENEYYPVGADQLETCEARIVMATHRDLLSMVKSGEFRQDLYYRLCSQWVHLPPLRERREDISFLAQMFYDKYCRELQRQVRLLPDSILERWHHMKLQGNVRELEGRVRQYLLTGKDDLPMGIDEGPDTAVPIQDQTGELLTIKEMTERLIDEAMVRSENVQTDAAKLLGISQQALSVRLKKRRDDLL